MVIGAVDNGVGKNRITEARMPTERVCSIEVPRFTLWRQPQCCVQFRS